MVGTPMKLVTFSASISSRARPASHRCIITSLEPPSTEPSMTGTHPVTWNNGTTRMNASLAAGVGLPSGGLGADDLHEAPARIGHERGEHRPMGRHRALGVAGRARGVEDGGVGIGVDVDVGHRCPRYEDVVEVVASGREARPRGGRRRLGCRGRAGCRRRGRAAPGRGRRPGRRSRAGRTRSRGPVHHSLSDTATAPMNTMAANASIHSG